MAAALGLTESASGVEDVVKGETFTVYPNPTSGYTTIAFNELAPFCSLYTMDGRIVRQWPLVGVEGSFSVDLSNLTVGTYVVQIGNESQLVSIVR
jgi:bacillolysin